MSIRNHLFDPEATPPRNSNPSSSFQQFSPAKVSGKQSSFNDDSWYEASEDGSPIGNHAPSSYAAVAAAPSAGSSSFFSGFGTSASVASVPYGDDDENFDNEPPLLEELGIRYDHIWSKTQAVINLRKQVSEHILDDTDLAGPVCFCLLLGAILLLSGKVHFGYIYGFSMCGCLSLQGIISLMHPIGLDFWQTCSVLGYCLLPVIFLAALATILRLRGILGLIFGGACIAWCTLSATRLIDAKLNLTEQYWLVAYPVMLLYSCFVIITIF
jgi:hypothetical protein